MNLYGNDILRLAYIYVKDKDLIEDIFQDVFVKIYKNYYKFNRKSSEKTWIITITINTCKDYLRTSWIRKVITFDKANSDLEYEISKDNGVEDSKNEKVNNPINKPVNKSDESMERRYIYHNIYQRDLL